MTRSIDVVIPTYENWKLTESCLHLLREQTVAHSVIVADNASADGTGERIRARFPEVRLVELDTNLGFTGACNRGAATGDAEVIVLLNNDVEPRVDFLERLVEPMQENHRLGSVASLLVRPGERTIDCVGLTADRTLAGFPRLRGRPLRDADSPSPVLAGPSGAAGAYRRSAWEAVGGLDESVSFYGEDLDLALRMQSAGWPTAAAPDALAVHLGSATIGRRSAWQRYQSGFSRGYFLRRYRVLRGPAAPRALVTEAVVVVGDAVLSRDASAFRGRLTGWRAAGRTQASPTPPKEALDSSIGFLESLRLRRAVYSG